MEQVPGVDVLGRDVRVGGHAAVEQRVLPRKAERGALGGLLPEKPCDLPLAADGPVKAEGVRPRQRLGAGLPAGEGAGDVGHAAVPHLLQDLADLPGIGNHHLLVAQDALFHVGKDEVQPDRDIRGGGLRLPQDAFFDQVPAVGLRHAGIVGCGAAVRPIPVQEEVNHAHIVPESLVRHGEVAAALAVVDLVILHVVLKARVTEIILEAQVLFGPHHHAHVLRPLFGIGDKGRLAVAMGDAKDRHQGVPQRHGVRGRAGVVGPDRGVLAIHVPHILHKGDLVILKADQGAAAIGHHRVARRRVLGPRLAIVPRIRVKIGRLAAARPQEGGDPDGGQLALSRPRNAVRLNVIAQALFEAGDLNLNPQLQLQKIHRQQEAPRLARNSRKQAVHTLFRGAAGIEGFAVAVLGGDQGVGNADIGAVHALFQGLGQAQLFLRALRLLDARLHLFGEADVGPGLPDIAVGPVQHRDDVPVLPPIVFGVRGFIQEGVGA